MAVVVELSEVIKAVASRYDQIEAAIDAVLEKTADDEQAREELVRRGARAYLHDVRRHWRCGAKGCQSSVRRPNPCTRNTPGAFEAVAKAAAEAMRKLQIRNKRLATGAEAAKAGQRIAVNWAHAHQGVGQTRETPEEARWIIGLSEGGNGRWPQLRTPQLGVTVV